MNEQPFVNLPSTKALRYFVTTARLLSVTAAAQALYVSQAAVSKQIKGLETQLGQDLFIRDKQRLYLSELGQWYYQEAVAVLRRMQHLSHAVEDNEQTNHTLHIGVLTTFAAQCLIPLLPDLYQRYPWLRLRLSADSGTIDFSAKPYDAMISFNNEVPAGVSVSNLHNERLIAVASPSLLDGEADYAVLASLPQLTFTPRPLLWHEWFSGSGFDPQPPQAGLLFETFHMLIQAAIAGLGVALIPSFFLNHELESGQLQRIHTHVLESERGYFLAVPNAQTNNPGIITLRQWLAEVL
ncbi:LysR substrate-binding domain-containing protein [Suttonella sp. R2A3]|uniref:LysR substrate-binding domain-containing protein n=1 Tax=Suttonella sp. R2A3 TaxID=2908648 RepID=UPI001F429F0C|nr:LysR substrate-binding domain-containing protein [Suttonella sp. R2A3]UJF24257.1 LysR substrate-binding domain-containing protein [Suttonella sp. R2A3]